MIRRSKGFIRYTYGGITKAAHSIHLDLWDAIVLKLNLLPLGQLDGAAVPPLFAMFAPGFNICAPSIKERNATVVCSVSEGIRELELAITQEQLLAGHVSIPQFNAQVVSTDDLLAILYEEEPQKYALAKSPSTLSPLVQLQDPIKHLIVFLREAMHADLGVRTDLTLDQPSPNEKVLRTAIVE